MRLDVSDLAQIADSGIVRVSDLFSQFHLISNEKFIENRVYDEEDEALPGENEEVDIYDTYTKEQRGLHF
jgi:hypothetical protein